MSISDPVDRPTLLRDRNIVLRPLRVDDVERVAEIQAEPGVASWRGPPNKAQLHRQADGSDDEAIALAIDTDAVRTLTRYLIAERGHHRLTIDPAADNATAIRAYKKVGFRTVGVMREYWRSPDGKWQDGLLMDLLSREFD